MAPIALNQATRLEESSRIAALRKTGPESAHDAAKKLLEWTKAHGTAEALRRDLAQTGSNQITVRETPRRARFVADRRHSIGHRARAKPRAISGATIPCP